MLEAAGEQGLAGRSGGDTREGWLRGKGEAVLDVRYRGTGPGEGLGKCGLVGRSGGTSLHHEKAGVLQREIQRYLRHRERR